MWVGEKNLLKDVPIQLSINKYVEYSQDLYYGIIHYCEGSYGFGFWMQVAHTSVKQTLQIPCAHSFCI